MISLIQSRSLLTNIPNRSFFTRIQQDHSAFRIRGASAQKINGPLAVCIPGVDTIHQIPNVTTVFLNLRNRENKCMSQARVQLHIEDFDKVINTRSLLADIIEGIKEVSAREFMAVVKGNKSPTDYLKYRSTLEQRMQQIANVFTRERGFLTVLNLSEYVIVGYLDPFLEQQGGINRQIEQLTLELKKAQKAAFDQGNARYQQGYEYGYKKGYQDGIQVAEMYTNHSVTDQVLTEVITNNTAPVPSDDDGD